MVLEGFNKRLSCRQPYIRELQRYVGPISSAMEAAQAARKPREGASFAASVRGAPATKGSGSVSSGAGIGAMAALGACGAGAAASGAMLGGASATGAGASGTANTIRHWPQRKGRARSASIRSGTS